MFLNQAIIHYLNKEEPSELDLDTTSSDKVTSLLTQLANALNDKSLTALKVSNISLQGENSKIMADIVKNQSLLKKLSICANGMDKKEIRTLLTSLKNHQHLIQLALSNNNIDDDAIEDIITVLNANPNLTAFNLSANPGISHVGAIRLAGALLSKKAFTLNLEATDIGPLGVKPFIQLLKTNCLSSLLLSEANLTENCAKEIATQLKSNRSLTVISFDYDEIGPEGKKAIDEALKINTTLTHLTINYPRDQIYINRIDLISTEANKEIQQFSEAAFKTIKKFNKGNLTLQEAENKIERFMLCIQEKQNNKSAGTGTIAATAPQTAWQIVDIEQAWQLAKVTYVEKNVMELIGQLTNNLDHVAVIKKLFDKELAALKNPPAHFYELWKKRQAEIIKEPPVLYSQAVFEKEHYPENWNKWLLELVPFCIKNSNNTHDPVYQNAVAMLFELAKTENKNEHQKISDNNARVYHVLKELHSQSNCPLAKQAAVDLLVSCLDEKSFLGGQLAAAVKDSEKKPMKYSHRGPIYPWPKKEDFCKLLYDLNRGIDKQAKIKFAKKFTTNSLFLNHELKQILTDLERAKTLIDNLDKGIKPSSEYTKSSMFTLLSLAFFDDGLKEKASYWLQQSLIQNNVLSQLMQKASVFGCSNGAGTLGKIWDFLEKNDRENFKTFCERNSLAKESKKDVWFNRLAKVKESLGYVEQQHSPTHEEIDNMGL